MTNEYRGLIKELRVKKGISQLELANKLNISRASYIAVEQGKRDLTLSEAQKLADTFGVSLEEMESGIVADYAKYKEMILAFLRTSGEEDGKVPKTKLAKLLYLADFAWFYDQL
ncbi:MAG: helix-turn-helix transcriptional regulator [Patescibacteria group bacterium]